MSAIWSAIVHMISKSERVHNRSAIWKHRYNSQICQAMAFFFHFLSLAEKQMRFRAKDIAIHEQIAPLRANHIARITSDFTMDLINKIEKNKSCPVFLRF